LSLLDQINQDIKSAMLEKRALERDTLRMLLAEIKRYQIDEKTEATDEVVLTIINKMVKQRKDSIEQFTKGGRDDLASKEKDQLEVIKQYLPEQLSEDKIREIVEAAVNSTQASSMQDMGKVMGAIKSELQGKADMGLVSQIVKSSLSN
jgi:uncharacterized protein YqeY|tara:strand:- start:425 stop:871 length:447 start_codon:yes stop_codon:yes gene_type:complete